MNVGRDVFASSEGFSSLESFVRQSIAGVATDLGGSLDDNIARDIVVSNAEQTSLMQQMVVELRQLREENVRLRKANERFGNAVISG